MRVSDEETQEAYSQQLGAQDLDEQSEGLSYGISNSKDGGSVNTQRREKRIVLPSEIKKLDDFEGYLQLSGNYPVARVKFERCSYPKSQPAFVPRAELSLDSPECSIKAFIPKPQQRIDAPPVDQEPQDEAPKVATLF
jgi:type IV secretory pathway TraG/TraD family ATPase VirD4